ncbi:MAG: hypothetical protein NTX06_10655 [Proteobacteria bacterium]|nr:hypothetical protein [Pseudomonadota bacterium]
MHTFGNELRRETQANVDDSWQVVQWTATAYDAKGRPVRTESSDGTITESAWNCCGKTSDTDARGITTTYTYDDLKRVISQTTPGPLGDIVTSYTYDAAGRRQRVKLMERLSGD